MFFCYLLLSLNFFEKKWWKTEHLFLIKKCSGTFWEKSANDARQKSITDEEPVTEDSKRISSLRNLKSTITEKPKENLSLWKLREPFQWGPSGDSGLSITFVSQKIIFCLLVMVFFSVKKCFYTKIRKYFKRVLKVN